MEEEEEKDKGSLRSSRKYEDPKESDGMESENDETEKGHEKDEDEEEDFARETAERDASMREEVALRTNAHPVIEVHQVDH